MFVLGKVLSTTAVLLCILCLAAPLKKTKAGQKIKGLRILLKPHVLYGWLLLVIGLMHGIMAGRKKQNKQYHPYQLATDHPWVLTCHNPMHKSYNKQQPAI